MRKNYFFGKYYKFIAADGYTFAVISSFADDGRALQLITPGRAYVLQDTSSVKIGKDTVVFRVNEQGLSFVGKIRMSDFHPLKYDAMGPFKPFAMECSHSVYSMYHDTQGEIEVNGERHSYAGGCGYIEGDRGRSFPQKYFWYNSVGKDYGVTVAIATIPFGLVNFEGILGFVSYRGKEYRLCTYNFAKVLKKTKNTVVIKRGEYILKIRVEGEGGHDLKAPSEGNMTRLIKENVSVATSFTFRRGGEVILQRSDPHSSLEQMF